jgi:hypothetical protein
VTVRVSAATSTSPAVADCTAGNHVVGGGVTGLSTANNQGLTGSFPSTAAGAPVAAATVNPQYWGVTFVTSTVTVYALCVPN